MIGRMSAAGRLGTHRYPGHENQDWTYRTFNVCNDIQPPKEVAQAKTRKNLDKLLTKTINQPKTKLRPVLHMGLYKYHIDDFKLPKDYRKKFADKKREEKEQRLSKFVVEIDAIEL